MINKNPKYMPMMAGMLVVCGSIYSTAILSSRITEIGRYSTVLNRASPAQINPLLAVSQFKFPAVYKTISEAIHMVLDNSGYQLVPENQLSMIVKQTLSKVIPASARELGPLTIKDVLLVLMGAEVFNLVEDPLHREVNFEVKPAIAKQLGVSHVRHV